MSEEREHYHLAATGVLLPVDPPKWKHTLQGKTLRGLPMPVFSTALWWASRENVYIVSERVS